MIVAQGDNNGRVRTGNGDKVVWTMEGVVTGVMEGMVTRADGGNGEIRVV